MVIINNADSLTLCVARDAVVPYFSFAIQEMNPVLSNIISAVWINIPSLAHYSELKHFTNIEDHGALKVRWAYDWTGSHRKPTGWNLKWKGSSCCSFFNTSLWCSSPRLLTKTFPVNLTAVQCWASRRCHCVELCTCDQSISKRVVTSQWNCPE